MVLGKISHPVTTDRRKKQDLCQSHEKLIVRGPKLDGENPEDGIAHPLWKQAILTCAKERLPGIGNKQDLPQQCEFRNQFLGPGTDNPVCEFQGGFIFHIVTVGGIDGHYTVLVL